MSNKRGNYPVPWFSQWPKTSFGQAFHAQPKSVAVITKKFETGSTFIMKDKNITGKRILLQNIPTNSSKAIDPLPEIDRLDSKEYPHLGSELKHELAVVKEGLYDTKKIIRKRTINGTTNTIAVMGFQFEYSTA